MMALRKTVILTSRQRRRLEGPRALIQIRTLLRQNAPGTGRERNRKPDYTKITPTLRKAGRREAGQRPKLKAIRRVLRDGGRKRNRTAVRGFAVLCIATLPSGQMLAISLLLFLGDPHTNRFVAFSSSREFTPRPDKRRPASLRSLQVGSREPGCQGSTASIFRHLLTKARHRTQAGGSRSPLG